MKIIKYISILVFFIALSNVGPLKIILTLLTNEPIVPGLDESIYITKDKKYIYSGAITDTLKNSCYIQYKSYYPNTPHTLYRIQPIKIWKFWHWAEYIYEEKWKQPYLDISDKELENIFKFWRVRYNSPNGTIDCRDY
jgi:hypothetical protein